jgi:hypothetical protein
MISASLCKTIILITLGGMAHTARAQNLTVKGWVHTGLVNTDSWFPYADGNTYVRGSLLVDGFPGYARRLTVDNTSGHVGIGLGNPAQLLHLYGANPLIEIDNTSTSFWGLKLLATSGWQACFGTNKAAGYWYDFTNDCGTTHQLFFNGTNWVFPHGSVGIGTLAPGQKLEVAGGVRLNTTAAKPACSATQRGTFWVTQGAAGVKDSVQVCAKDAANAYAWRTLY